MTQAVALELPQRRLQRRAAMAQRDADARQQLADAERLDQVVVGAGVEQSDLPRLGSCRADATTIGSALCRRTARTSSAPSPSGRPRSRTTGRAGRAAERRRLADRNRGRHLEALGRERGAQQAADLGVVFDDQHLERHALGLGLRLERQA